MTVRKVLGGKSGQKGRVLFLLTVFLDLPIVTVCFNLAVPSYIYYINVRREKV